MHASVVGFLTTY